MAQVFPTKTNLINTKKSLELAELGYDLMDRKRNILVREMMLLIDEAKETRTQASETFSKAYSALAKASVTLGDCTDFAENVPVEQGLSIDIRSVMGVELPTVVLEEREDSAWYGLHTTNSLLDEAYFEFKKAKELTVKLAGIENSVYRLADAIKKTQKRANALDNILIPRFEETIRFISDALEEKEREDFSRLKVMKNNK